MTFELFTVCGEDSILNYIVVVNISTAYNEPLFPSHPLARMSILGDHPQSSVIQDRGIFQHITHIPAPSPASFEYEILYSCVYFIIAHSLYVLCPWQPSLLIIHIKSGYR